MPGAKRFNTGKPRLSLIPTRANMMEAAVWTFGAEKYGADNWRKGMSYQSVLDSMGRHYEALKAGQLIDPETGLPHAAHIKCNASMLIEFEITHPELNDLPKGDAYVQCTDYGKAKIDSNR